MEILITQITKLYPLKLARFTLIIQLVSCCFFSSSALEANETVLSSINTYDLTYTVKIDGLSLETKRTLVHLENGQYAETSDTKNILGKITEKCLFGISNNGKVKPQKYTKQQDILLKNKHYEVQAYNWDDKKLSLSVNGKEGQMDIQPGYFDTLSLNQQLRLDLNVAGKELTYNVIRKGKLTKYRYQLIGHEILETTQGSFNSLRIERIDENGNKKTRLWFATDWDNVILKLEKLGTDSKITMILNQGNLNGIPILPLKN